MDNTSEQKQICLLHYAAPPVVGGVESVIGHHARLMVDHGLQVQIVAGRGEALHPQVAFERLPLADSRHPQILEMKAELDQGRVPPAFYQLRQTLVEQLGDLLASSTIVIAHNVCSLAKNLALTAALRYLLDVRPDLHWILWHHDLAWTTPRYQAELHAGYPWDLLRQDWPAALQVVVSRLRQAELAGLLHIPAERIHVVPNGLDLAGFLKLEGRTQILFQHLDLFDAAPIFLLPVRITPRKNIEQALRVMSVLKADFPHTRLVVTGPMGPHNPKNLGYFQELLSLRDQLDLKGQANFLAEISQEFLPDAVVADFYRLSDALLLPSREEGFGIPVLEAGISGIPVFCADIPPLRELAGEQGIFFSPDAPPEKVAGLIIQNLRQDASFQLRSRVRSSYTWEKLYQQYIQPLLGEV